MDHYTNVFHPLGWDKFISPIHRSWNLEIYLLTQQIWQVRINHPSKILHSRKTKKMGFNILKIPPFSSSITTTTKNLIPKNCSSYPNNPIKYSIPTSLTASKFQSLGSKSYNLPFLSTGSCGKLHQLNKRNLNLSTMAATPGSVQKSEEEWRAILSPEQFRILREKGTEYALVLSIIFNLFFHFFDYFVIDCPYFMY